MRLAFVLLERPLMPAATAIAAVHERGRRDGPKLLAAGAGDGDALSFALGPGVDVSVMLMPVPVPGEEADRAAGFSVSAVADDWQLPPHSAHLVVVQQEPERATRLEGLRRFTRLLAAVTEASGAVGVYWGDASATHSGPFFCEAALEELPVMLWTGVSVVADGRKRVSVLSLGIRAQLGIDDLMVTAPRASAGAAVAMLFDLLGYAISRNAAVAVGETVGRDESERLYVKAQPSPIDPEAMIWRVDLP